MKPAPKKPPKPIRNRIASGLSGASKSNTSAKAKAKAKATKAKYKKKAAAYKAKATTNRIIGAATSKNKKKKAG